MRKFEYDINRERELARLCTEDSQKSFQHGAYSAIASVAIATLATMNIENGLRPLTVGASVLFALKTVFLAGDYTSLKNEAIMHEAQAQTFIALDEQNRALEQIAQQ